MIATEPRTANPVTGNANLDPRTANPKIPSKFTAPKLPFTDKKPAYN
jgi:hypothetical protein